MNYMKYKIQFNTFYLDRDRRELSLPLRFLRASLSSLSDPLFASSSELMSSASPKRASAFFASLFCCPFCSLSSSSLSESISLFRFCGRLVTSASFDSESDNNLRFFFPISCDAGDPDRDFEAEPAGLFDRLNCGVTLLDLDFERDRFELLLFFDTLESLEPLREPLLERLDPLRLLREPLRDRREPLPDRFEPLLDRFEPLLREPLPDLFELPLRDRDEPLRERERLRLCLDPEFEREFGDLAASEPIKLLIKIYFRLFRHLLINSIHI